MEYNNALKYVEMTDEKDWLGFPDIYDRKIDRGLIMIATGGLIKGKVSEYHTKKKALAFLHGSFDDPDPASPVTYGFNSINLNGTSFMILDVKIIEVLTA